MSSMRNRGAVVASGATLVVVCLAVRAPAVAQAPTDVRAVATGPTTVEIVWIAVPGEATYIVERADDPRGVWTRLGAPVADTRYTDGAAPIGATVAYRVWARGPRGTGASEPVLVTTSSKDPTAGRVDADVRFAKRAATGTLVMTGRRFSARTLATAPLAMTGRRFTFPTITTPPLVMTGRRGEP